MLPHPLRRELPHEGAGGRTSLRDAFLTPPEAGSSSHGEEPGGLGGRRLVPLHRFVDRTDYKSIETFAALGSIGF